MSGEGYEYQPAGLIVYAARRLRALHKDVARRDAGKLATRLYSPRLEGVTKVPRALVAAVESIGAELERRLADGGNERRLKRYTQVDLLILDEIGYLPCDAKAADLLFNIISSRHEKRSTVISTNLAYKQWGTIFPGAACVGALVDRFIQHCHTMDIDADSWRNKEAGKEQAEEAQR